MYTNDFAKSIMEDPEKTWGPFVYYDMFSWNGYWNYFWDQQGINWIVWWELIKAFVRDGEGDWTWGQSWTDDFIDKNRIFPEIIPVNRYDYNYWSSIENGYDCNGREGKGYYCYCPSQGYICTCQPLNWYKTDLARLECFDHYGYNCEGNFVDGEANWCQDPSSTFYYLNQKNN